MAVRIVFRGLILFEFRKVKDTDRGPTLFAHLINDLAFTGDGTDAMNPPKGKRGGWEHYHSGEVQIVDDDPKHDVKPVLLDPKMNVNIVIAGDTGVSTLPSFDRYVPSLEAVIAGGTDEIRKRNSKPGKPDKTLIQNTITVNRGVVHVKNVINWDEDGFPLRGRAVPKGQRPGAPVQVKFMGSTVHGHVASEVMVEIDDTDEIDVQTTEPKLKGRRKGPTRRNHRVPPGTVEVLVTNYEYRQDKPVAWGLDYQWLFAAAGYADAELAGPEFDGWIAFASRYDAETLRVERDLLLRGDNKTVGKPFPYIESAASLSPLQPLSDQYNPPVCLFGTTTRPMD